MLVEHGATNKNQGTQNKEKKALNRQIDRHTGRHAGKETDTQTDKEKVGTLCHMLASDSIKAWK